jgi:hypothetical protein
MEMTGSGSKIRTKQIIVVGNINNGPEDGQSTEIIYSDIQ